ncbi:MAG: efflux RND transporter permease subunit [Deltaproteobacteria bacterium]|nr:efflux RND transporter permease subunit [Deltaproteobacteria bacterium]
MLNRIFEFSLGNRFLILVFAGLVVGVGIYALRRLPIDAVPDVTPNQVQILTNAPGLGPVEVEQFITFPVETAMSGLPGITLIRSVSRFGLSAVTVYFDEGMDIYFCRRLVMECLPAARDAIPAGLGTPEMGPISTGLGEIYQFEVKGKGYSLMELRSILEWEIAFKLKSVPGVVEVNTYGGELKTYEVQLDASKLVAYNLPLGQVFEALERNNANAGGAYIEHAQEQYLIRGEGLVQSPRDIENIVVAARNDNTPIYVRNLGRVAFAPMVRQGAVTRDGRGEAVTGVVMMLIGENSRAVVSRVRTKIEEIRKALPPGVTIDTYYDRTELVRKTIKTVTKNLSEGALLVITVLLLLLGNLRGGLIVASAIPLSMLIAFTGMVYAGLSGNLMSLGAIDFGLIVDGSVVMIENIARHIAARREQEHASARLSNKEMRGVVLEAGREVLRPIFFAVGIIIIVYLPLLTLQGVEGKMFRPMALTVVFALAGSLVLSFTLMPVLASFFLRTGVKEEDTWLIRQAKRLYRSLLARVMHHPALTGGVAAGLFAVSVALALFMGAEFIPRLDEGAIALQAWRLPSVSLEESIRNTTAIEQVLKRFPEVVTVVSRTGRAEIATDPMGAETRDIYLILKPHEEWQTAQTREGLIAAVNVALTEAVPGTVFSYSQPIELRVQELIAGVRSDVAITIFGEDLETLKDLGDRVVRVVAQVPGAADTKAEQIAGLPYLRVIINREAIARYGINASQILDTVAAMGGRVVGEVFEGQRRFFLQVRFVAADRQDFDRIKDVRVADPSGRLIPLGQLADIRIEEGPAQISREKIHRRLAVETNVRGRDLASFVADAQRAVERRVKLPPGYWIEWGGQFENLQRASARLAVVVPMALFLIFVLLYSTFNAATPALLIYLNVPLAATGGIFALALRGMPFSISAGVGFIALFGVAVLNGVVLMSYVPQMRREGLSGKEAARRGAEIRLRPVLMTALVASLGFVPMALSTSSGAEVQRPLATVVIGGLITSTVLTLLVLPTLYAWIESRREAREDHG